jgi:hypothetical protein
MEPSGRNHFRTFVFAEFLPREAKQRPAVPRLHSRQGYRQRRAITRGWSETP